MFRPLFMYRFMYSVILYFLTSIYLFYSGLYVFVSFVLSFLSPFVLSLVIGLFL